jgi:deazaflavin-dependent oxidoreductase (nitroreductase family)
MAGLFEKHPSGFTRAVLRAPTLLYRARLGRVLGGRFVLLEHTGRRSGVVHQNVLEVVDHDDAFSRVVVCSGWGERSDWYRNVVADPNVSFESKGVRHRGVARRLAPTEAEVALQRYGERHPHALAALARRMIDEAPTGDLEAIAMRVAAALPVVELIANDANAVN